MAISLKELVTAPRLQARSLSELAPWWYMLPGESTVLCCDGALLVGYEFQGLPMEGVEVEEIDRQIDQLDRAMRSLNDRITVQAVLDVRTGEVTDPSRYANPMAEYFHEKYLASVKATRSSSLRHYLFLCYRMPARAEAFLENVRAEVQKPGMNFFSALAKAFVNQVSRGSTVAAVQGQLSDMQRDFDRLISDFESVAARYLGFERLKGKHFAGALYARLNISQPAGHLALSPGLKHLNEHLAADNLAREGDKLRFSGPTGSSYAVAVSIDQYPADALSSDIDLLLGLGVDFTLSQSFQILDTSAARSAINRSEEYYLTESTPLVARIVSKLSGKPAEKVDDGMLLLADDAKAAAAELTAGGVTYGYYCMTILALGRTEPEAELAASKIAGCLRSRDFKTLQEVHGLLGAFTSTLPGAAYTSPRRVLASANNLVDLIPLRGIDKGESTHPFFSGLLRRELPSHILFRTDSGVPYGFVPHSADVGHGLIIGGTGGGKSSFVMLLLLQFQKYFPCASYIFDKDYSIFPTVVALGGQHIDLVAEGGRGAKMAPVRRYLQSGHLRGLRRWLEVLLCAGEGGRPLSATEREEVYSAIQQVHVLGPSHWRLGQLYSILSARNADLASRLAPYVDRRNDPSDVTRLGTFATYFDNDEDAFAMSDIVGMETGGLLEEPALAGPFMEYAFYCIERKLDGSTPAIIYVEEAWYMLQNVAFAARLEGWQRTLRKKRAFIWYASQAVDEFQSMPSLSAFLSGLSSKVFLVGANGLGSKFAETLQAVFDLNDAQIDLLRTALPKRDYLIVKGNRCRLVNCELPRELVALNEVAASERLRSRMLAEAESDVPGWGIKFIEEISNA